MRGYLLLAVIALAAAVMHVPMYFLPMNRDSGTFAYGGWRILHGALVYRDFWDNKLPGVFYIDAAAIKLFGATTVGLAVFQVFYGIASAWAFFAVARKFCGSKASLIAALLFTFYHACYGLSEDGNLTESYIALPALLCVLLILKWAPVRKGLALPFLAGVLGALAGLIKQPAASVVPAAMLFAIFSDRRGGKRSGLAAAAAVALGAAGTAALAVAWMAQTGILAAAIDANLRFNRLYFIDAYTDGWSSGEWNLLRGTLLTALPLAGATAAIVSERLRDLKIPASAWLVVPWLALDLLGLVMGGRFYPHYFLALLPSTLLLTGIYIDGLRTRRSQFAAAAVGLLLFVGPVWSVEGSRPEQKAFPISSAAERECHALYWIVVRRLGQGATLPAEDIALWVREHTDPSDTIYVWGYDPRIGFLAQRAFPARYIHLHPLGAVGFDREARIRELAKDLDTRRPKYIIDESQLMPTTAPPLGLPGSPPSWSNFFRLDGYEPVKEVVARRYRPVEQISGAVIFQLQK